MSELPDSSQPEAEPVNTPEPLPRYRYATVLPSSVEIKVSAIRELLPAEMWKAGAYPERVSLPCAEVFASPTPRIRVATLKSILPTIVADNGSDPEWVNLPQAEVALAYRTGSRRELLPPEPEEPKGEPATPAQGIANSETPTPDKPSGWKRLLQPILAKNQPTTEPTPTEAKDLDDAARTTKDSDPMSTVKQSPTAKQGPSPMPEPEPPKLPLEDRPLENLATFQRLLLTDEELTLRALPNLIAKLPGIRACRLEVHDVTLRSTGLPANIADFAAEARTALEALRKAVAASGKSLERCLTLYETNGPITLLEDGDASLLILHDGRHFVPGVRETVSSILAAIASSTAQGHS